jgi:hypothetical protein
LYYVLEPKSTATCLNAERLLGLVIQPSFDHHAAQPRQLAASLINEMLPSNLRKSSPFSIKLNGITFHLMSPLSYSVTVQDPTEKVRSSQYNLQRDSGMTPGSEI